MRVAERWTHWWAWQRYGKKFGTYRNSTFIERPELITNHRGIHVEDNVYIRPHARLECVESGGKIGRIEIGEQTTIQFHFHVAAAELVKIAPRVLIAGRVYISDHDHVMPWTSGKLISRPVIIGEGCWLGEGCCILKGVELGPNCVVGANAVVTKSFPAGSIIGGVPAKLLRASGNKTDAAGHALPK
ncbi:MAG: acyltransferase [Phycisphaerae bacterium]